MDGLVRLGVEDYLPRDRKGTYSGETFEFIGGAMDWDDLKPKPPKGITLGESLETLSVGELDARIAALQQEIVRVQGELAAKKAHEAAAAAIFKR